MHADPEHRWDISTMTVKEALVSWKGPAVKAAMEEEIRSLINMGTWELVERPPGVNIMKNRKVLTTKYHVDDTVEREKARLVVKGFTQVYGADYDETFAPVGSYVTLRIFLSIVAVLNLNLQLDMKNAFLQSKLDRVLYMPDYFNDGTGRVCKLLKSLYGLKQSPLLWYLALNDVLVGAGWKKSQVDEALYFKVGDDGVACWVLVYVDDLLAASSSTEMLKELKELLEPAFELCEISPVQKYLGLEIVRDRSAGKLWLHQQGYADKLRRRFIDEEQTGRTPKTPVSVDAYAELTFDDEEAQERQEEECEGSSRPAAVGELVDEEVDLHGGHCTGADFREVDLGSRPAEGVDLVTPTWGSRLGWSADRTTGQPGGWSTRPAGRLGGWATRSDVDLELVDQGCGRPGGGRRLGRSTGTYRSSWSTWLPGRPGYLGDEVLRRSATVAHAKLASPTSVVVFRGRRG
ncbi:unnamed protein product [Closterium sp. Naga37s-1]|nr:unnamed protein product [Closterium sp. Naga37s-1]